MPTKIVTGLGVIALLAPMPTRAQDGSGEAAGHWAAIAQCAAIDRADARHACMDDVLRRAGLLSDARVARSARQEFGNENRAAQPAPAPPAVAATLPVPRQAEDIDEIVTTVAAAQLRGDRRLVVTTAEGSVWEQTQSETFRTVPRAGDRFAIARAALGSFRCSFERSSAYRCRRVD